MARRHLLPRPRTDVRSWNATQLQAFLGTARSDRLFPALWLAANTGMRRSELLGLRWEDIDLASGSLCFFSSDGAGTTYGTRTQATLLLKRRGGAHVRQCHRVYRVQPVDDPVDVDERDEALAKRVLARAFGAGAGLNPATFGS